MNVLVSHPVKTFLWFIAATLALLYVPFAAEYMLQYFTLDAPQWQNHVLSMAASKDFAWGPGSIAATQHDNFTNHRWAMLMHAVPGSLALMLCIPQLSKRLRQRHIKVHRAIGKAVMLLVLWSMLAGAAFLLQAHPDQSRLGGIANTVLLWGLDLTTLTALTMAYVSVRCKDIQTHRAFVILMFTMLTTTPLLRYAWLVIAQLVPSADQLTAQNMAAIFLVAAAPGLAMIALVMSEGFNRPQRTPMVSATLTQWVDRVLPLVSLLGVIALYFRMNQINTGYDTETFIAQALPLALLWIAVTLLKRQARRSGQIANVERLRIFLWGIALVPVGINIVWSLLIPLMADPNEAYMTAAMAGAGGSMYAAYFWVVLHDATLWRGVSRLARTYG